jgi:outer membrane protein assembly factor BamB
MRCFPLLFVVFSFLFHLTPSPAAEPKPAVWGQWRGPTRDGQCKGPAWPDRLSDGSLKLLWRVSLDPSYSGPIVADNLVFTTATRNQESEVVYALDRKTGKQCWRVEWKGAMTVPFFAASNGSWIRATPAYDGQALFVAGMRDVLVCLDAQSGQERWRVDFVKKLGSPLPAFGFVSSPLVEDDALYVQAGASVMKLKKATGDIIWRTLKTNDAMMSGAFSSPVLADLAGRRQLLVQTRQELAGVDPATGKVLWRQVVPSFRGMNILTPVVFGDAVFTSSYQNNSWLFTISRDNERYTVEEKWSTNAQGYMSTPVVIDGHAYLHLQTQRFTCIDLKTGERTWTSKAFGKYCSLVARRDRILALDQRGILLLIKANPKKFELLDEQKISDDETWAHLAVSGNELYVRELHALAAYRWGPSEK